MIEFNPGRDMNRMVLVAEPGKHMFEGRIIGFSANVDVRTIEGFHGSVTQPPGSNDTKFLIQVYQARSFAISDHDPFFLSFLDNAGAKIGFSITESQPQPETTSMNLSTAVLLMNDRCRVIEAVYEPDGAGPDKSKPDAYKAPRELFKTFDENVKAGDVLIVPSSTRHCITTVKCTDVDVDWDADTHKEIKWIIGTVDMANFEEMKALDEKMFKVIKDAEKTDRKNKLREKLTAHMDETQKANLSQLVDSTATSITHDK